MTLADIIRKYNIDKVGYGMQLKKNINFSKVFKAKYIDVYAFYYDDEESPYEYTWVDVEGMGYGWLWCANKIRRHLKILQRKAVIQEAMFYIDGIRDDCYVLTYERDGVNYLGFMYTPELYVQVRTSNKELHYDW